MMNEQMAKTMAIQKRGYLSFLLILIVFTGAYSQTIVGVVTGMDNKPLSEVKVSSSENTQIVLTDSRGEYSIEVSDTCRFLIFSQNGITEKESIHGRKVVNIQMPSIKGKKKHESGFRFNIMINGGGPVIWGAISGSVLIKEFISLDVGLGLGKIYGGTTIYFNSPFKNTNWQPYIGANISYFEEFMGPVSTLTYLPVGLRYLNYKGTSLSFEIAFLSSNNEHFMLKTPVWGGVRFGKYF